MAEDRSDDERTEEPTARRLQKAREDGQVPRSQELPAAAVMLCSVGLLVLGGWWLIDRLAESFAAGFVIDRRLVFSPSLLGTHAAGQFLEAFWSILPLLAVTAVIAVLASSLTGGFLFSWKAVAPKLDKFDLFAGLKRMFGVKALVEAAKAVAKFVLVAGALYLAVAASAEELAALSLMELGPALALLARILGSAALLATLALCLIALIDVPYQRYDFTRRMRMTRQEVKDELKDMEGRPEVRAAIRRRQREMAAARMMDRVREADVVVTNPDHFAVALAYDPDRDAAPVVVAKGADLVALRIGQEARKHGVEVFPAPDLARALYFTTDIGALVPEDLYQAVAEVVSYVFGLARAAAGGPVQRPAPVVPERMRFTPEGKRANPTEQA